MPLPDTLLRKLFNWAVSCGIIAAPVGVYERLIYERLISIGSRGHLKISDKPFMEKRDWINRLGWGGWESIAESLPQSDLENLARGLIITERELEWPGGSVAASIKVFRVYEKKFGESSIELANWARLSCGHAVCESCCERMLHYSVPETGQRVGYPCFACRQVFRTVTIRGPYRVFAESYGSGMVRSDTSVVL